jgi:hypothetical protein
LISKITVLALAASVAASATPLIYGTAHSRSHGGSTLFALSTTNGAAKPVGVIGFDHVDALAFDPSGRLFGVGQNGARKWTLLRIDLISGAGTAIGGTGLDVPFDDMAFRSDGMLFGYARATDTKSKGGLVYSIDSSTGVATVVGNLTSAPDGRGPVALSPDKSLYTVEQGRLAIVRPADPPLLAALHYDPAFGPLPSSTDALKFDSSSGQLWAVMGNNSASGSNYLAAIDVKTGMVAQVGKTAPEIQSLAIQPQPRDFIPPPLPIPSSLLLLSTGLLALLGWHRWSRSRRTSKTTD